MSALHARQVHALAVRTVNAAVIDMRRTAAKRSFRAFCLTYLPAHFKQTPSLMHVELFAMLQSAVLSRAQRIAIAAPRGHAKSTIVSQAYILWCICFRHEPFILMISNTIDQASDCLSMVKHELQTNPLLLEDFPEVCESPEVTPTAPRWRKEEIITRNGVKVTALGAEKKIRGRKHQQHRPTLIVMDDVENETEVRSADQRANKLEWFNKAVLKAGSSVTNVIVVGTILHYDSLLAALLDRKRSPGWTSRKYQAVMAWATELDLWERWQKFYTYQEEITAENALNGETSGPRVARWLFDYRKDRMLAGTSVLWPEREDYYDLMVQRLVEGRASFDSEKQNEPVDPADCYFPESDMHFWDEEFGTADELIARMGPHKVIYGACDPSMGKFGHSGAAARSGDYTAIITLLLNPRTRMMYVLDADIRRRKPDAIIQDIIAFEQLRRYRSFAFETNQFQQFLFDEVKRRSLQAGVRVPIYSVTHTTDKIGRIQRLQPLICSGMLRFSRRHVLLLEQLRQFPMGAHDDGPDALEMAVEAAQRMGLFHEMRQARFSV